MNQDESKLSISEFLESCPTDQKGRKIVPDEIMEKYYKELPEGTINESGTVHAYHGGKLNAFTPGNEAQKDIQRAGGKALQAEIKQRRTFAETIEYMLAQKADPEDAARLGLDRTATKQDVIMAAMLKQANKGNVKASVFLRDTIGQQPVNKQEISAEITAEDRELIERVSARLSADNDKR